MKVSVKGIVAVLVCVCAFAFSLTFFSDRAAVREFDKIRGQPRAVVTASFGMPFKRFESDSESYPVPGYSKPKSRVFDECLAYDLRYGIVYVYIREGKVYETEYVGG